MDLAKIKLIYVVVCALVGLIILYPTLASIVKLPGQETYSEIWLLGPGHKGEGYPFNISQGQAYSVFLEIRNHMSEEQYYMIRVKFKGGDEPWPSHGGVPSSQPTLLEYRVSLVDGEDWEKLVSFSIQSITFTNTTCTVSQISVDNHPVTIEKTSAWNETNLGFYFTLFFELWRYNNVVSGFQYDKRFVGIPLNMTQTAPA
jgi:hypothetical protein